MNKIIAIPLFCLFTVAGFASEESDSPLELSMQRMAQAYHQLSLDLKQPVEASKSDYLALAGTMKTEERKAHDLVPKKAAALPADQQAAMVADYQKSMDQLDATIDGLSKALQASQWDEANKLMAAIKAQMSAGHKTFRNRETKPVFQTIAPGAAPSQPVPPPAAPPASPQTSPQQ